MKPSNAGKTSSRRTKGSENDIAGVLNKGIEKTLAARRRVVDKFVEVYHEGATN
jgi:hypothetical protein